MYEILGKYFGNAEDAKTIVAEPEQVIESNIDQQKDALASKKDIMELRIATKQDIAGLRKEISESKVDLIKWMVGFNTVLAGIILAVVKLL
jgi:hypothetical protein